MFGFCFFANQQNFYVKTSKEKQGRCSPGPSWQTRARSPDLEYNIQRSQTENVFPFACHFQVDPWSSTISIVQTVLISGVWQRVSYNIQYCNWKELYDSQIVGTNLSKDPELLCNLSSQRHYTREKLQAQPQVMTMRGFFKFISAFKWWSSRNISVTVSTSAIHPANVIFVERGEVIELFLQQSIQRAVVLLPQLSVSVV